MTLRFATTEPTPSERALRDEVRSFLGAELPRGSFEPGLGMGAASDPAFTRRLAERGWVGMAVPARYGGHDRTAVDRFLVVAELLRWGAPIGYHWVSDRQTAPMLLRYGSEEQRRRFLPAICAGEIGFSIGMSEPDSGSDLASVTTRAERVDGGWSLSGTKVWTSGAHENDWVVVLCRTSPLDADDRHGGLSQLIVDLSAPGVTVSPIPLLDGNVHFNEVVFDRVFVPDELLLGEEGRDWAQNTSELAYERGGPDRWLSTYLLVEELLRTRADHPPPGLVDLLGDVTARWMALHDCSLAVARAIDRGEAPAREAALVKEMGTRFEQEVLERVLGLVDHEPSQSAADRFGRLLATASLTSPAFTIRGGTIEILRSIIARGLRP